MRNAFALILLIINLSAFAIEHGGKKLLSYTLWKTVTKEELKERMKKNKVPSSLIEVKYEVDVYDITYKSCWHDSSCIRASGLVFIPKSVSASLPEVVYHHGTRIKPGRRKNITGEDFLCLGMAVEGYLVLQPDYIGLGHGEKFHLYQQYESLGQSSADMIDAVKELKDSLNFKIGNHLFLTGYSEGGYAAVAANKFIQEYRPDIKVTATAGNSGAYDMGGVQSEVMFQKYSRPHYLPYLLRSLNEVYRIVPDINKVYKPPFDTLIPKLFDGSNDYKAIDKMLPEVPKDMLLDTFVSLYLNNPDFPLRKILEENSLCHWKPENPVMLCYCTKDEQVNYKNSIVAEKGMKAKGAKHVTLRNAGRKYGHTKCALFATMYSKLYFDSFLKGSKYGRKGNTNKRFLLSLAMIAIKP